MHHSQLTTGNGSDRYGRGRQCHAPLPVKLPLLLFAMLLACQTMRADEARLSELFHSAKAVLEGRCLSCHNQQDHKGSFSLETRSELMESGYVVAGNVEDSQLLSVVVGQHGKPPTMPRDSDPLSAEDVEVLADWITDGAPWPDDVRLTQPVVDDFNWWSFRPIVRPDVPTVKPTNAAWVRTPIDSFILAQHDSFELSHSPMADKRTLIRRITYDLTGLPPTPDEVRQFEEDESPDAWDKLVSRLLDSPRYGERWARHWLDVVKYADTCGYDKDKLRPNAWPYRDYVIRSFNQDKSYSRFVQEQLAGDVLFPGDPDGILGLGFIAAGPWDFIGHVEVPESKTDGMVARSLDRDEMVSNTLNTFCSVTIQCARCHNHKFDPFTQEHYYSLQSVFAAVDRAERPYDTDPEIEQQRSDLMTRKEKLTQDLQQLKREIKIDAGPELGQIEQQIASLKPLAVPADKRPEFGYHSQISTNAGTQKWVAVDLGKVVDIAEIRLHPCHDDYAGIGAGFGFPVRFRIDAYDSDPEAIVAVLDQSGSDFANPGLNPVVVKPSDLSARVVKITAIALAERSNDFIMALAELEVLDSNGENVAEGCAVTALDSIEAPVRWRKSNLTDGIWAQASDAEAVAKLAAAEARRSSIMARVLTEDRKQRQQKLTQQQADVNKQLADLPVGRMVYAAATSFRTQGNFKPTNGKPRTVKVLHRGNVQDPRNEVQPGTVPLSADVEWRLQLPSGHSEADRRAALAGWITDISNPLTWRSIVNRIWQYHFGRGLADSPNDLGRMGQLPTHPKLLDWLADEFRRTQSFKHLHRLIVTSAVYQQASTHNDRNADIDADNRFLWRMNRRRLSAEELRDSILAVSGKLKLNMGGPGFYLFELEKTAHSPHYEYHKFDPDNETSHRRSIYRFIVRSQPDPFMTALDCADSSQSTPRRSETLTSLQALSLLNNRFNLVMAEHFADRVVRESPQPVVYAFQLTTGRTPSGNEVKALSQYAKEHGMANLCRVLLNASEFVFLD